MITIFTTPRVFHSKFDIIQRNAILSWTKLLPRCEVILFGDEKGTAEVAAELGVRHVPDVACNELGTPLISDMFNKAQEIASHSRMAYVNADIILLDDFTKAVGDIRKPLFLMVGRRWDVNIEEPIKFDETDWKDKLKDTVTREGKLHGFAGIDYFIFPRGLWKKIPPFALGRTAWDNWFLYQASSLRVPLIDATEVITAIHQKHDYSHYAKGETGVWKGQEAKNNLKLAGGYGHLFTIRDVDWILTSEGLRKPKLTIYRFLSFPFRYFNRMILLKPFLFPGWAAMISWRKLRRFLKR